MGSACSVDASTPLGGMTPSGLPEVMIHQSAHHIVASIAKHISYINQLYIYHVYHIIIKTNQHQRMNRWLFRYSHVNHLQSYHSIALYHTTVLYMLYRLLHARIKVRHHHNHAGQLAKVTATHCAW